MNARFDLSNPPNFPYSPIVPTHLTLKVKPVTRMLLINGHPHKTIADAAAALGVSTKTVRQWIHRELLPPPPEKPYGTGYVMVFTDSWISDAKHTIENHRESRRNHSSKSNAS